MANDLQSLLNFGLIGSSKRTILKAGIICDLETLENTSYEIIEGWNIDLADKCDTDWKAYWYELACYLKKNYSETPQKLNEIISSLSVEDAHWEWIRKANHFNSDEYHWFFFKTASSVEAACLVFHPKTSVINTANIFYIEFIAVAPWNRDSLIGKRKYKHIGKILLKEVMSFCTNTLRCDEGFCLHSLPKAEIFYEHIGMGRYPQEDKDGLPYFEMGADAFVAFQGGTYGI